MPEIERTRNAGARAAILKRRKAWNLVARCLFIFSNQTCCRGLEPMSWITIVWSMNAAACLTLAGIYLLVWCKQRENWVHLYFRSALSRRRPSPRSS